MISSYPLNDLRNSMKFLEKMCLNIILKVTKKQVFTLSLEDTFLEKRQGIKFNLQSIIDNYIDDVLWELFQLYNYSWIDIVLPN